MSTSISTAFYDALFDVTNMDASMNILEETTLANVRQILNDPEQLSKHIPPLPVILLELIETLKDQNANFLDFIRIIEKDRLIINRIKNSEFCQIFT
ncbi:hypothetical protein L3081_09735 [Colwellia sp. MSW7]|uniref:Uncharacterized protein n=1 Tax=Colwellia maritima TaxID=2912588 RepID=A0ABS9X015_9GAMM|nr:hypothetical protein [Colwellia maritima]MCI2283618.1 hypothetical protein [Colwellia maritima]